MTDNEFFGCMLEKRVDLLSERKERPGQEETLDEMEQILEERMKPSQRISMGMLLDKVRWKDEEIYKEGFSDGIRAARRLYDMSAYSEMEAA